MSPFRSLITDTVNVFRWIFDSLPDSVQEFISDLWPFAVIWSAWLMVMLYAASLLSCTTTSPSNGLSPHIELVRDTWCQPDHDVRLVIDSTVYVLDDTQDRRRIPVATGSHVLTHYAGSHMMRRWTVEVRGREFVKLECRNRMRRRDAYPVPKQ